MAPWRSRALNSSNFGTMNQLSATTAMSLLELAGTVVRSYLHLRLPRASRWTSCSRSTPSGHGQESHAVRWSVLRQPRPAPAQMQETTEVSTIRRWTFRLSPMRGNQPRETFPSRSQMCSGDSAKIIDIMTEGRTPENSGELDEIPVLLVHCQIAF